MIETVKKLNWSPDIIHVHGWLASFLPLYLKSYYENEPLFDNSKIVTSVYNNGFNDTLNAQLIDKIKFDGIENGLIEHLELPSYFNVMKTAIDHSDAVVIGSEELPGEFDDYLKSIKKPVLKYHKIEE